MLTLASITTMACATQTGLSNNSIDGNTILKARVIYVHGAGDDSTTWAEALVKDETGLALDWKTTASHRQSAPAKGYRLGLSLAAYLSPGVHTVYAHSAGAWVAQGMADGLVKLGRTEAFNIVFLDPFTALSIFQPFAGARMLGRNAASVETWYTTLDPIPFTAGKVSAGEKYNLDDRIPLESRGTTAHWAVIDLYMHDTR